MRRTSVRTGHVNPGSMPAAYKLHKLILEVAPYHLSISPLDVDYVELMFGFDLECKSNHDQVVFEALYQQSPLAELVAPPTADSQIQEVQPVMGLSLTKSGDLQAFFEVKTRPRNRRGRSPERYSNDPISILLTVRKYGPIDKVEDLKGIFDLLANHAEALATQRLVPHLLTPIARQITSSP
jgi:hypothetical protein